MNLYDFTFIWLSLRIKKLTDYKNKGFAGQQGTEFMSGLSKKECILSMIKSLKKKVKGLLRKSKG